MAAPDHKIGQCIQRSALFPGRAWRNGTHGSEPFAGGALGRVVVAPLHCNTVIRVSPYTAVFGSPSTDDVVHKLGCMLLPLLYPPLPLVIFPEARVYMRVCELWQNSRLCDSQTAGSWTWHLAITSSVRCDNIPMLTVRKDTYWERERERERENCTSKSNNWLLFVPLRNFVREFSPEFWSNLVNRLTDKLPRGKNGIRQWRP